MNKKKLKRIGKASLLVSFISLVVLKGIACKKKKEEDIEFNNESQVVDETSTVYERYVKRGLDFILSFMGLMVLAPLYLVLSIAIIVDDPGPVLFTQKRVGQNKQYFKLHKFRSMKMSTPHDTPTHLLKNPEQYITRVGKILRKYSLDELPQIWDIFVGNMSIIGPRPALWNQDDLIAERDKYLANDVKPGLTGWAQINGRDELEIDVKAKYDGEYVDQLRKNSLAGLYMDTKCFFGTISSVMKHDGVVEGGTGVIDESHKKILILTNHSYMLYRFRKELIQKLQEDYEVVIGMPFVGHEDDFMDMDIHCINMNIDRRGMNPLKDIRLLKDYKKLIEDEKPDMVLTYSIKPNIYAGMICRMKNIPYCVNVQGLGTAFQKQGLAQIVTLMYKKSLKKAKVVFFENIGNAEEFINRRIIPESKITVLPGAGINLNDYEYTNYPDNDKVHFLYLGRIMKEKGIDELFYSIKELNKDYQGQFVLDMVGFFEDEYKEQVEKLQKEGLVQFYGFKEEPRPYYKKSDCVVLPSYHEGLSNVLLEASAIGRPVITTNIHGCLEAVNDHETGLLCHVQDKESLYDTMKEFMELSKEARIQMGKLAREKMEKEFSKETVVQLTVEQINK